MAERIIDMSDPVKRSQFVNSLTRLTGKYRFIIKRYRPRRSDRQNRYYWPCFVNPFAAWMRDHGTDATDEDAHEILKHKFLQYEVAGPDGQPLKRTRSTTDLDTSEFNEYLDRCSSWLNEFCGIVIPEPDEYRETS